MLYEADTKAVSPHDVLAGLSIAPDPYAVELVEGVDANLGEIDRLIEGFSEGWALARMPVVDKALLRLATYELSYCPDVPVPVVLDEAVELAKQYSTGESGRFVNGVLASVAAEVRGDELA